MKTSLTAEQSARLIELGIDANKASVINDTAPMRLGAKGIVRVSPKPIFTLANLFTILPKWIKFRHYLLYPEIWIDRYSEQWCAKYQNEMGSDEADTFQSAEELIDCLYNLIVYLIEDNLYKP